MARNAHPANQRCFSFDLERPTAKSPRSLFWADCITFIGVPRDGLDFCAFQPSPKYLATNPRSPPPTPCDSGGKRVELTLARPNGRIAIRSSCSFIKGETERPALRSLERRLRYGPPIRCRNLVRQTDTQDSVWPSSFWKEVRRQYQCEWRAPSSIVDPVAGAVNSRIVERKDVQITKRNSSPNLDFLASREIVPLK